MLNFCFRRHVQVLCVGLASLLFLVPVSGQTIPTSGQPVPSLAQLDTIMEQYMTQYSSPGANLSVSVDGKLVYARGYGYADVDTGEFVQPDSRMRIASNSKIITAVGILKLIEEGKLTLQTKPFATIFTDLTPPPGTTIDPRVMDITVQNLLEHKAGYDDGAGYPCDPVFCQTVDDAATAYGLAPPADVKTLISYELGQPLQHDPGTTYAYSNLGYLTLGYIIERVSGTPYATWIEQNVFNVAKMTQTLPAASLESGILPYEVHYYDYPGAPLVSSEVPPVGSQVPYPYGGLDLELALANGAWTSTPMDLLRLWDTLNGQYSYNILNNPQSTRVGDVPPVGQNYTYDFYGSLPGTNSLVHLNTTSQVVGRVVYSAIFNTRDGSNIEEPESDADNAIQAFVQTVKSWPSGDLFPTYAGSGTACSFTLGSMTDNEPAAGNQAASATLTDANYCAWSATSNNSWLHVSNGGPFGNSSSVAYTVDANTGPARTGTITIAGQTLTVSQLGVATSTTLTLTGTGSLSGSTETAVLTATLSPYKQNGSSTDGEAVTFTNSGTSLGTAKLSGGVATLTATVPNPKVNDFGASYGGDANFGASSDANVTINVSSTSATVSPSTLTFPSTVVNTVSASMSSTFANTGTTTLNIGLLSVRGSFKQTNTCGGSVAAGAMCVFTVTFNPTTTGPATGSIDVSDEAGDQVITLSGNATAAPATSTTLTVVANPTSGIQGTSVMLQATLAPYSGTNTSTNGETVTFQSGGTMLGSAPLTNGVASIKTTTLPVGADTVTASYAGDTNFGASSGMAMVAISAKPAATVTIGNLSATYDGTPHAVSVTTSPANLATSVTYNGGTAVPTEAGSYTVLATVTDPNYSGSATATLVIAKAAATVTLSGLSASANGSPHAVTVTTSPASLTVSVTYNGSATAPSAAGSYAVAATVTNADYSGSASGTLVISASTAMVTLGNLNATYDGTAHAVSVTTVPAGLAVSVTYAGSATVPIAAGSYAVVATVTDPSFTGSAMGTLVIGKAAATVTLSGLQATANGSPQAVTVTTVPAGLAVSVTYAGSTTAPSAAGSYAVVATVTDPNYTGSASGTLVINAVPADYTFGAMGSSNMTVSPGGSASYAFGLAPNAGGLPGVVTFSATGLPKDAVATFDPTSVPATGGAQTVTMTVATAKGQGEVMPGPLDRMGAGNLAGVAFALLVLPLVSTRKMRKRMNGRVLTVLFALCGLAGLAAVTGCGGSNPKEYNITVTAASGTLQHTATVMLTVK